MLSYVYPQMGVFWSIFWFFIWVVWLLILFRVIIDIFRSNNLRGGAKALWLIFVVLLPYLGVFIYLIAHGTGMGQRDVAQAQAHDEALRSYIREAAGSSGGTADELAKLANLRDTGVITADEFSQQKAKLLA